MQTIKTIERKIIDFGKYVDAKNDKLSKVIKFFQEEVRELGGSGFSKKEQIEILSLAFDRSIKYTTYVDLHEKYVDIKESNTEKDVEKVEQENEFLKPQVEAEREILEEEEDLFAIIEDNLVALTVSSIIFNALESKGFYDEADKEDKEFILETAAYNESNLEYMLNSKDELIEYFKSDYDLEDLTLVEFIAEIEKVVSDDTTESKDKNVGGRPALPESQKKTKKITAYFTEDENKALEVLSEKTEIAVSKIVRLATLEKLSLCN